MTPRINLMVAATSDTHGIGFKGTLPWRLRGDMNFFRLATTHFHEPGTDGKNTVIMGRKTWDSIPAKFRPLPDRRNIVLTRNTSFQQDDIDVVGSLEEALTRAQGTTWVIGGGQLYQQALASPHCHRIFLTRVHSSIQCDTFFPDIPKDFVKLPPTESAALLKHSELEFPQGVQQEGDIQYEFEIRSR